MYSLQNSNMNILYDIFLLKNVSLNIVFQKMLLQYLFLCINVR